MPTQHPSKKSPNVGFLLFVILGGLAVAGSWWVHRDRTPPRDLGTRAEDMVRQREELDRTVWAHEVTAQLYESTFIALWDDLRKAASGSPDPFEVLTRFPCQSLAIGSQQSTEHFELGITARRFGGSPRKRSREECLAEIEEFRAAGFRLAEAEFHHSRFLPRDHDPARSEVSMKLNVENPRTNRRFMLNGTLDVTWSDQRDEHGRPIPARIAIGDLEIIERDGPAPFTRLFTAQGDNTDFASAHPIVVYDLDGNGFPEIVLPRWNRLYRYRHGRFEREQLCTHPQPSWEAAVVADFTGDSFADLLTVAKTNKPILYSGDAEGNFPTEAAECANVSFEMPSAMTAGDMDGDGDLDVLATQYKLPYQGGQMPTPYFDANDGYPTFLLRNDGQGQFTDVTRRSGLQKKQHRRTYGSSFVDLNDDGNLDLIIVSDYAGIDIYYGNGRGEFSDVTDRLVDEPNLFGMSHTYGDFDLDGQLDFFVIGMSSTTARRLARLGLGRRGQDDVRMMRSKMGYGNRMYLRRGNRFEPPSFQSRVARTGWSWGSSSFDFDNDGDEDIYVANGHRSGESAADYCTRYWCHDLYTGNSRDDKAVEIVLAKSLQQLNQREISWNGFEHNFLFMNRSGTDFVNVSYLMGVGFEYDSRAVVAEDLDADGHCDLLVAEYLFDGQGYALDLHAYRNNLQTKHHWIGVRLREEGAGRSPVGARIRVITPNRTHVARIVTGDSYLAQHSNNVHFGLGDEQDVQRIIVEWLDGHQVTLEHPAIDQYHTVLSSHP